MSKRIHLGESVYFDIDVTVAQLVVIVALFVVMFALPIYVHARITSQADQPGQVVTETYTASALAETQGQVAGATTERTGDRYIRIPILNIDFDTTLTDPGSLPLMFGGAVGLISLTLLGLLIWENVRR